MARTYRRYGGRVADRVSEHERDLDVVVFGATGFVGRLTAAYLAEHAPAGTRVALAGRNRERLEAVRAALPGPATGWEVVVADATEPRDVAALAARTRVVATTVGPYSRWGMPLVEACATAGTHYCDLTGEVLFVRATADAWHDTALESGARIVHSCGFDSIPFDLGVFVTAETVAAAGDGELTETVLSVVSLKGGVSGGTIDSMRQQAILMRADPTARSIVADPYALSPDRAGEPRTPRSPDTVDASEPVGLGGAVATVRDAAVGWARKLPVRRDPATGHWTGPFVMAAFNTRMVRRSNALLGWRYGRAFRYREVVDFGTGVRAPVLAGGMSAGLAGLFGAMAFEPTRAAVGRFLPKPGEGPSEAAQAAGRFRMVIRTRTTSGAAYRTTVGADYDPGYGGTAVMLGEAALALAFDGERLPGGGGVLTPATGVGQVLVDRLVAQGFTFACEKGSPSSPSR